MSHTAALMTDGTIRAARIAAQDNPGLLSAALRLTEPAAQNHQHADEVADVAANIVAAFLPPAFRGYGYDVPGYSQHPATLDEAARLAQGAAAAAVRRAAAAVSREHARTESLDAITDTDPGALDALTGSLSRSTLATWAPTPGPSTTARDLINAALSVVEDPAARDRLAAAVDAWTPDARSLVTALAAVEGWTNASPERKATARRLSVALADVAAYRSGILTEPHSAITETTDARTPARRDRFSTPVRTRADLDALHRLTLDTNGYAAHLGYADQPQRDTRWTRHEAPRTAQHDEATAALADALAEQPGRIDPTTDPTTASHVVVRRSLGYDPALGYDDPARVIDATTGETIAPAVDYAATMRLHMQPAYLEPRTAPTALQDESDEGRADAKAGARVAAHVAQGAPKKGKTKGSRVGAYGSVVARAPHLLGMTGR